MKKTLITFILIIVIAGAGTFYYFNKKQSKTAYMASNRVLAVLKEGNERFVSGKRKNRNYGQQILDTKLSQRPEAVVLSCMDSRSIPEVAFDQGIGKIFTIRVAGNVINRDIIGSMEYGTKIVGAHLIVVLGHTNCGAVKAACKNVKLNKLSDVLDQIQPAVKTTETDLKNTDCTDPSLYDAIAKQNVINMVNQIPQQSTAIAALVNSGQLKIVGAMYDVSTGKITFIEPSEEMNSSKPETK